MGQGRSGSLGLLKVDVLAPCMLSAIRRAFDLINEFGAPGAAAGTLDLATVRRGLLRL